MSCGYNCEYSCQECDVPDKVIEFVNGYNQALEDAEKRYREWSNSEYGKVVADDVLPIRVLRSLKR